MGYSISTTDYGDLKMNNFLNTKSLLKKISKSLEYKKPFSAIRFGDGDIKIFHLLLNSSDEELKNEKKFKQTSIDVSIKKEILRWYSEYSKKANCISSFDEYFNKNYLFKRSFSSGTLKKVKDWKNYYEKINISNSNFCSPDFNHYIFLTNFKNNLYQQIKNNKYRICLITCYDKTQNIFLENKIDCGVIKIPGRYSDHFKTYDKIIKEIENKYNEYDLFLVGGGVYGRLYTGFVKDLGGVGLDIGKAFDRWTFGDNILPIWLRNNMYCHGLELRLKNLDKNIVEKIGEYI
jgi:hypothetical protein